MKKKIGIILILVAIVAIGCWAFFVLNQPQNYGILEPIGIGKAFTRENLPKIDCATAMEPMAREIVKSTLSVSDDEEAKTLFQCTKTIKAYENLINGNVDIIFLFGPSDEQIENATKAGVEFETTTIGYDAFVFIVNKNNPVDTISSADLRKIYNGQITNWKELGGNDEEILAYQRPKNSGSQTLMEKFMNDTPIAEPPQNMIRGLMDELIEAVAATENQNNSLGYSVFYYANEMIANPNVKFVKVDGVLPTQETIGNGTYPITENVLAVIKKSEPKDSMARKLAKWCLSKTGQEAVNKGGYVKVAK